MNRDEFAKAVLKKINSTELKEINKEEIMKNGGTCKNGIYFIYDENENILYVGMVSDKKTASLKARFYDNGNSAHCNKYWFEKYAKFYRFYSFPKASEAELELIERLMIYINNQPVYNDKDTSESANDFEFILKKL